MVGRVALGWVCLRALRFSPVSVISPTAPFVSASKYCYWQKNKRAKSGFRRTKEMLFRMSELHCTEQVLSFVILRKLTLQMNSAQLHLQAECAEAAVVTWHVTIPCFHFLTACVSESHGLGLPDPYNIAKQHSQFLSLSARAGCDAMLQSPPWIA